MPSLAEALAAMENMGWDDKPAFEMCVHSQCHFTKIHNLGLYYTMSNGFTNQATPKYDY